MADAPRAAANGRLLARDPLSPRQRRAAPAKSVAEEEVSSGLDTPPEFTGSAVGQVGRPEMLPDTLEVIGPSGETLTLQRNEAGKYVTVNSDVPPPPVSANVDHPLLQQLRSRTNKPKGQVQRAPAYNHRMLWYMKPDGEIVPLQGDPGNRAYYEDKGYVVLRQQEEQMFLRGDPQRGVAPIRRLVIAEQRRRATLVTTIRSIAKRNPSVELVGDLDITPTEELEDMVTELRSAQGINFRLIEARVREVKGDEDDLPEGADTGGIDELVRKMARSTEQQRIGGLHRRPSPGAMDMSTSGQLMPGAGE